MDIAILDGDCFSLVSSKFFIENDLKMNCSLATQSESEFISVMDSGSLTNGAIIYFDHKHYNSLLAINKFVLNKGGEKLIVILEEKSRGILNLMRCLGVVWVVFRKERRDVINKLSRDVISMTDDAWITEMKKYGRRELLTQKEIMVVYDLLNGLTVSEIGKKGIYQ